MDQYDQDLERSERRCRKLQAEIDSLRVEGKRDAVKLDYYRSEIRKYQQDAKVMQDRVDGMAEMTRDKLVAPLTNEKETER